jgi:hypothetical protein
LDEEVGDCDCGETGDGEESEFYAKWEEYGVGSVVSGGREGEGEDAGGEMEGWRGRHVDLVEFVYE